MANEFKIKKGLIVNGSGSTILDIQGSQGQLFSVTDNLSGSLFSVNDISGLPILQVSSNDSVKLGTFNAEAIKVSGSNATITGSFSGSFSGNAFIQSGNSFGTTALLGTNDNQALALETSGSERMRITSAGNVGIGTTSPGYPLSIENTSEFLLTYKRTGGTSKLWGFGADNSSTYFKNLTDSTIAYTVTNGGNVGIGTSAPTFQLDVSRTGGTNEGKWARLGSIIAAGEAAGSYPSIGYNIESNVSGFKYIAGDFASWIKFSAGGMQFNTAASGTAGTAITVAATSMTILQNGNVGIGMTPTAKLTIKAPGALSTDIALRVRNSADTSDLLSIAGNGNVTSLNGFTIGSTASAAGIFPSGVSGRESVTIRSSLLPSATGNDIVLSNGQGEVANLSSTRNLININRGFNPTSGNGIYNLLQIEGTINQTGGANGVTRGLFINPTLTAAADFRAIETTVGNVVLGSTSGNVGIGTTAPNAKLDVNGNTIITGSLIVTNGITGSLFGTASWAQNVTTATNALSASNFVVTSTLQLDGTLTDYATVNSTIVGDNNLYTQATGSYTSAFVKYSLNSGINSRAGEFIANWNGTTVTYFDNSTTDIGTTSDIVFSSAIVSSQIQVNATAATSGWKIKTLATFI